MVSALVTAARAPSSGDPQSGGTVRISGVRLHRLRGDELERGALQWRLSRVRRHAWRHIAHRSRAAAAFWQVRVSLSRDWFICCVYYCMFFVCRRSITSICFGWRIKTISYAYQTLSVQHVCKSDLVLP